MQAGRSNLTLARGKSSWIEYVASHPNREAILATITEVEAEQLLYDWRLSARPAQLIPGSPDAEIARDDWRYWLVQAGRGFGKTRTGSETTRAWAEDPKARILMVASVAADVREVMIEGPSGLMSCYPPGARPEYNPSRHLVTFPSGAIGITRSADEPERLRGPQFTKFWADELCAWRFAQEAWDQIMFGFRLPTPDLRGIITTTPKPIPVIKKLIAHPGTVVTRGSSYDNRANLSASFFEDVIAPYEGTRLGRQEIHAELLEDTPGALWTRRLIDATRILARDIRWDLLVRIVVAVDPAVTSGEHSAETGIVVAALAQSGHVVIIDDLSVRGTPLEWAKVAVAAYYSRGADRIVGEVNNGGDLVEGNIRGVAPDVAFRAVRASRGKMVRAEPVAALYEQGRVHHAGNLGTLEDQMCTWVPGDKSPDRMDALVWAVTELVIQPEALVQHIDMTDQGEISPV